MSGGLFLAGFRKALQRFFLVVKFLEDAIELRDLQNFFDLWCEADHFHFAALLDHAHVAVDQRSDSGAVEIQQVADVEDDLLVALLHQVGDRLAQNTAGERRQLAREIHDRNFTVATNSCRKIHDYLLARTSGRRHCTSLREKWRRQKV